MQWPVWGSHRTDINCTWLAVAPHQSSVCMMLSRQQYANLLKGVLVTEKGFRECIMLSRHPFAEVQKSLVTEKGSAAQGDDGEAL